MSRPDPLRRAAYVLLAAGAGVFALALAAMLAAIAGWI